MARYCDLCLIVDDFGLDFEGIRLVLDVVWFLGYRVVALATSRFKLLRSLRSFARKVCGGIGLDVYLRVNVRPRSVREGKEVLRRLRGLVEVLCVECGNMEIARFAARDNRVDIIYLDPYNLNVKFDLSEVELISSRANPVYFEVRYVQLVNAFNNPSGAIYLGRLRTWLTLIKRKGIPVIVSSGARSPFDLKSAREIRALIEEFSEIDGRRAMIDNPLKLIEVNKVKLSKSFIMPGVMVVGREEPYEVGQMEISYLSGYKPKKP